MPTAVLLAFANDWVDEQRHLRGLLEESKAISDALAPLVDDGAIRLPPPIHNATVDDLLKIFSATRSIRVFHFGGHASGAALMFENQAAHAAGLAAYLGTRGLVLVFLNGCSTEAQVRALRAAGIKAVVATTSAIQDTAAVEFATAFYRELATRPLREAFEAARDSIRLRHGNDPRSVTRDAEAIGAHASTRWPWVFDCEPAYETWTLRSERRQSWRRRLFAAIGVLAVAAFCMIESRDVLTAVEQADWDAAVAQTGCDGFRAYLRAHPRGMFADEAQSRLAGRRFDAALGPEREVVHVLRINRAERWPTRELAHADARARGDRDAATMCRDEMTELVEARSEPREWDCNDGFACGFDGEIVCVVRNRIRSERCR